MNQAPPRTGQTPLVDAELYLFDALFDVTLRVGALRREEFAAAGAGAGTGVGPLLQRQLEPGGAER